MTEHEWWLSGMILGQLHHGKTARLAGSLLKIATDLKRLLAL